MYKQRYCCCHANMWHGFVLCKDGNKSCKASKDSFKHANNPQLDTKANRASLLSPTRCWRTARPPAGLHPPAARCGRPPEKSIKYFRKNKKKLMKKTSKAENFWRKKIGKNLKKKIRENFFEIIFFRFSNFFSVEIFHMMSTLRMQNFPIIGQGVSALQVRTDTQIWGFII